MVVSIYLGKLQDVEDTLWVIPYCTVTFYVPDQGDGYCTIITDEVQGASILEYVVEYTGVYEDFNHQLIIDSDVPYGMERLD